MKRLLRILLINAFILVALLVLLEGISRFVLSRIYNRDHDSSLIMDNKYLSSSGLKESAFGIVWGNDFHTDANAGRKNRVSANTKKKWLFIGDSVTEGVGVADSSTFVSLLSERVDTLDLVNSSLIGYSIADYYNVLRWRLAHDSSIAKVTLCYCLNDIYAETASTDLPAMAKQSFVGKLNTALQNRCATYKLLKLFVYQNSDRYFRYDSQFYNQDDARFVSTTQYLLRCDSLCSAQRIKFEVLVLPYRSQLKSGNKHPQEFLAEFANRHGINLYDALPHLYRPNLPNAFYLFADEIHFSAEGHRTVADFLIHN